MGNTIKYSGTSESNALNKGNWYIGTGDVGKGLSPSTGYWSSLDPPAGGYAIYQPSENVFSVRIAKNDTECIGILKEYGYTGDTIEGALLWSQSQDDILVVNSSIDPIVTDGLVLYLDSGYVSSYPRTGTTWSDLSGNGNDGTLTNGPTFNLSDGSISFDGSNDFAEITSLGYPWGPSTITVNMWFYPLSTNPKTSGTNCNLITVEQSFEISIGNKNNGYSKIYYASTPWSWRSDGGNHLVNDQWNMVTFVHASTYRKIYANGSVVYTSNNTGGLASGTATYPNLLLMKRGCCGGSFCSGNLATTTIYSRPLSDIEVLQNYNATKSRYGL